MGSGLSRRQRRWLVPDWKPVGVRAAWKPEDPGRAGKVWWEGPGSLELAAVAGGGASGSAWELLLRRRRSRLGLPRAGPRSAGTGR